MVIYWLLSDRVGSEHKPFMWPRQKRYLALLCTPSRAQTPPNVFIFLIHHCALASCFKATTFAKFL